MLHPKPLPDLAAGMRAPSRLRVLLDAGVVAPATLLEVRVVGDERSPEQVHSHRDCASTGPGGRAVVWEAGRVAEHLEDGPDHAECAACTYCDRRPFDLDLPPAQVDILDWVAGYELHTNPLYRVANLRADLTLVPDPSGHPGLDAYADRWRTHLIHAADRLARQPGYQSAALAELAEGHRRWAQATARAADADAAAGSSLPPPVAGRLARPAPPLTAPDGRTSAAHTRRILTRDLVWLRLPGFPLVSTAEPLAYALDFDADRPLYVKVPVAGCYRIDWDDTVLLCDDHGYTAAEVAEAVDLTGDQADLPPVIDALRAAAL